MCPLFRGSTVHKEEDNLSIVDTMAGPMCPLYIKPLYVHDNLSIVDKMAGPNVSFIQSFHCTEEDNLSIVDKMAGPNVSFIQRFHCT